jgi:hypothetical protein
MSGDRTWYTVTAYRPELAAARALEAALTGLGFQLDDSAHPDHQIEWQASEYPAGQGLEIAEQLQQLAAQHRFAFELAEEATDFDMGCRYAYAPDPGVLHQTTLGNDHNHYLGVEEVWQAIDATATREELVEKLETVSGRPVERGLAAWRDQRI